QAVKEERDFIVRFWTTMVADDDSAERTAIHRFRDVHVVIVERPCADRVLGHVEDVTPCLPGADGVAAAAIRVMHAERPGAVGIYAVNQPVYVEAVRFIVAVADVNEEPLARRSVNQSSRNAAFRTHLVYFRPH